MRWLTGLLGVAALFAGVLVVAVAVMSTGTVESKAPIALVGLLLTFSGLAAIAWTALWPRRAPLAPETRRTIAAMGLYLALIAILTVLAANPDQASDLRFGALFVVTLPTSVAAFFVTYVGGVMIFGPDPTFTESLIVMLPVWLGAGLANIALVSLIAKQRREDQSARGRA